MKSFVVALNDFWKSEIGDLDLTFVEENISGSFEKMVALETRFVSEIVKRIGQRTWDHSEPLAAQAR